jgi:hypothetical protein
VSRLYTTFCRPVLFPCRLVCEPAVRGIPRYQGFDHLSRRGCAQALPKIVFAYQFLPPLSDRGQSITTRPRRGWKLPRPAAVRRLAAPPGAKAERTQRVLWLLLGRGVAAPQQQEPFATLPLIERC